MIKFAKHVAHRALQLTGYDFVPIGATPEFPPDFDIATMELSRVVRPFTMTSPERLFALRQSVQYVVRHNIAGAIVECGVWKGGSMMAVALTLLESDISDRHLYLFDTFEGMTPPTEADVTFRGEVASELLANACAQANVWACATFAEVKSNLTATGYPADHLHLIRGRVEETVPEFAPHCIALLRLDTDWYESTYHEMVHLWPRLNAGGVLIIDDYGHWAGARKAVDQYFAEHNAPILLNRVDYTGRLCVKNTS